MTAYARLFVGGLILALLAVIAIQSSQIHKWHTQADKQVAARAADRATYEAAQAQAAAANKAHVELENKLRKQINEASGNSFIADRDRLRAQSGAAKGVAGGAGASGVPKAAPGTPPEVVSLPPAELLRAQETELQLNALIDWVLKQSEVVPNK